ncbi:hypothetical protein pipiens_003463 [Culex pipiens pipiens]|uniref:Uncharacterized protein n=1 Tax=Culex pipiens pipiens TaxID=38569 RepID=A0ABD1D033_CULPP
MMQVDYGDRWGLYLYVVARAGPNPELIDNFALLGLAFLQSRCVLINAIPLVVDFNPYIRRQLLGPLAFCWGSVTWGRKMLVLEIRRREAWGSTMRRRKTLVLEKRRREVWGSATRRRETLVREVRRRDVWGSATRRRKTLVLEIRRREAWNSATRRRKTLVLEIRHREAAQRDAGKLGPAKDEARGLRFICTGGGGGLLKGNDGGV